MPEHYGLDFKRQFSVGDDGEMLGLSLTVSVAPAPELRTLGAELWADDADDWIAQVEASPAFQIAMTRHPALGFSFGVDTIG